MRIGQWKAAFKSLRDEKIVLVISDLKSPTAESGTYVKMRFTDLPLRKSRTV